MKAVAKRVREVEEKQKEFTEEELERIQAEIPECKR